MYGDLSKRGLWRRQFGGPVYVDKDYTPEARRVGIYNLPPDLEPVSLKDNGTWRVPDYTYYMLMQKYEEALAVIEVRNDCVGVITDRCMHLLSRPDVNCVSKDVTTFNFHEPIVQKKYKHVGYILTYAPSFLFYQWPYYLFQDSEGKLADYDIVISEELQEAPSLSIYPKLLQTNYSGVYQKLNGELGFV